MSPLTRTSPHRTGGPSQATGPVEPTAAVLGAWSGHVSDVLPGADALRESIADIRRPVYVLGGDEVAQPGLRRAVAVRGETRFGTDVRLYEGDRAIVGHAAPLRLDNLGDPEFRKAHGLKLACVAGAMANGIGSTEVVEAMSHAGMLGIFGAAGLPLRTVEAAIDRLTSSLGGAPFGFNLIHSPNEPDVEHGVVDLYLRHGVRLVEASAYMRLTLPLIRYRVSGIYRDTDGRVVTPNRVIAKASRVEVATRFFSPPPEAFLQELVARGDITETQARLAREIPVAQDLTAEADSAGHTDNRPALGLLPTMIALRDRIQREYAYPEALRVGAAGGIATPHAAAAAFAMGATYVLLGSVNQACVEAGTSPVVREMLAASEQADIAMAPAADMFEMGVRLQVLKRGTMFPMRAHRLYDLYRAHSGLEDISDDERKNLEGTIFRMPLEEIWKETRRFWERRDITQVERAERDPKHRMALVFRWYLGMSSRWANRGEPGREMDYQVWCGPAMGAFNEWVRGSALDPWENRHAPSVAHNMLHGAAVITRAAALRTQGVDLPATCVDVLPRDPGELEELLT